MRFSQVAGIPPLEYLTRWRMEKAGDLLLQGEDRFDEIARRVGYESGAAFRKAFKRKMDILRFDCLFLPSGRSRLERPHSV